MNSPDLSIIIPILNEQESIEPLAESITAICNKHDYSYIEDENTQNKFMVKEKDKPRRQDYRIH